MSQVAPGPGAEVGSARELELYEASRQQLFRRTDRIFGVLMPIQWLAGIGAALWLSPQTWIGDASRIHEHVVAAIVLGGAITALPTLLAWLRPGRASTRHAIATGQMLTSALLIHLTGGRIETHFHVFGSLAFLAFYRDTPVVLTATVVIAADHVLRGLFWPLSVYGVANASPWRALEHAGWVIFEDCVLLLAMRDGRRELRESARRRAELERARQEVEGQVLDRTRELARSEDRFRSLSASSPVGIFETDARGHLIYGNARFQEIVGLSENDARGLGWLEAVRIDDRPPMHGAWREAVAGLSPFHREVRLSAGREGEQWVVFQALPRNGSAPGAEGFVGTAEDVSASKHTEAHLIRARESALEVARLKSEFLANMSHEIRTPLNGVMGMIELARGTEVGAEQREYLEVATSSAEALLTVINDILDFSKIEAGKLDIERIAFRPRECVAAAMRTLSLRASERGLEMICELDSEVPVAVMGDPTRLRQVLINLIGNAIKFTERGEVVVSMRKAVPAKPGAAAELLFSVRDSGIGIPEDRLRSIFEAFSQADGSTTRRFGGTGLGLSISSRLVTMMGGQLEVSSQVGHGSTFSVGLPLEVAGDLAPEAHVEPVPSIAGRTILVADDNETNLQVLSRILEREGARVLAVSSPKAALAALQQASVVQAPVELAILDHLMPSMDGLQLATEIRRRFQPAPVLILLTSSGFNGEAERCRNAGFAIMLHKPIFGTELLSSAARGLALFARSTPTPPVADASSPAPRPEPVPVDGSESVPAPVHAEIEPPMRVLVAEDNSVNAMVATNLLRRRGHTVVVAQNGRMAFDRHLAEPFDLILMDVQMPELDGFAATAAIRAAERGQGTHVPIIALTAHAMKGDRERCLEAGMDGYATKPFRLDELVREIQSVCGNAGPKRRAA